MSENIGKLLLRAILKGMLLFHGIDKALYGTVSLKCIMYVYGLPEILVCRCMLVRY